MTLDEFLNRQRTETLQRFDLFWTESMRSTSSKSTLISRLRRAMLSESALLARFQALPPAERRLLEILLTSSDEVLAGLRSGTPEDSSYEDGGVFGLLRELAGKGFIDYQTDSRWDEETVRKLIPEEFADALRKMLGRGGRHPEQLLSLRSFVHSIPAGDLVERLPDWGLPPERVAEPEQLLEELLAIENLNDRIEVLEPPELRDAVRAAIVEHFGLLPIEEVKALWPHVDDRVRAEWKDQLERHLIGTIGSLSLEHAGLNIRSDYLIVFLEVSAAWLAEPPDLADTTKLRTVANGFGVVLDFACMLNRIQREELRLTRIGNLRKHGADETIDSLLLVSDEDGEEGMSYLEWLVMLATNLDLVQRQDDGTLTPKVRAIEWLARPIQKQAQDLIRPALASDWDSDDASHARHLRRNLSRWCQALRPGRWYAADVAAKLAVVQYLLHVVRGDPDLRRVAFSSIHASPVSLKYLADRFLEWAAERPLRMGVLDLALSGRTPVLVRTTQVAAHLFGGAWPETATPEGQLIVNPDFEIVLFPGGTPARTHYAVHRMARLEKIDQVFHYRIDEVSVSTAAALGFEAADMIQALDEQCRGPLPQNVRYSIETWAGRVYNVSVEEAYVLEFPSPELTQMVRRLPEVAPLVIRELAPTILALREPPTDRSAIRALQKLGIYVRR